MKTFKLLFIAFVAMTGLTCCSKDCGHDFIEHDYSNDILGTWSIIGPDYAEALVINADGTMDLTAVHEGEYFETRARYELANNRMREVQRTCLLSKIILIIFLMPIFSGASVALGRGFSLTPAHTNIWHPINEMAITMETTL